MVGNFSETVRNSKENQKIRFSSVCFRNSVYSVEISWTHVSSNQFVFFFFISRHVSFKMRIGNKTKSAVQTIAVKSINFDPSTIFDLRFSRGIVFGVDVIAENDSFQKKQWLHWNELHGAYSQNEHQQRGNNSPIILRILCKLCCW